MSYSRKKQYTASNGISVKVFEPKKVLKRAADISAKTAIIIAAAVWMSGGVFQPSADTPNEEIAYSGTQECSEGDQYSENSAAVYENASANADAFEDNADEDGFLNPAPGTLTSSFGTRWGRRHSGIDIGADAGTEIYAVKSGRVIFSGIADGYGNYVKLDHGNGLQTAYGHCSALAVNEGDEVKKGQIIAYVGSTGNSTGPHLHFEVRVDGEFKNPLDYVVY